MPINFPNSPSPNQLYTYDTKTWEWNGIYWEVYSALTSYITSAYTVGDGVSDISGVTGGNIVLKSFSGVNITIIDGGDKLTFSGYPQQNVVGFYLPLSGGTVTGGTIFQSGLTATTISATTISTPFTTGSVIFQGSGGTLSQNNSNLFWDNVNNRLGVLTSSPNSSLHVIGSGIFSSSISISGGFVMTEASNVHTFTAPVTNRTIRFITNSQSYSLFPTGNFTIGTTTDFGYKLDVSGTTRLNGNTLIGTTAGTGTYRLDVVGNTRLSASTGTSLTVISSGNSTSVPVFSVQGSQGELFSVTDSLTGSLFSVSDISGLPIMEVFSDSTIVLGDYQAPSLYTTKRVSSITATTGTTIYSFPTSAYTSSFVDYYVSGSTGLRAGNIMAIWSGSSVNFTETSTNDLGNTTPVTFGYVMSGSSAVLRASASTGTWIVESIVRGL
jgi:hypothetical protein